MWLVRGHTPDECEAGIPTQEALLGSPCVGVVLSLYPHESEVKGTVWRLSFMMIAFRDSNHKDGFSGQQKTPWMLCVDT